MEFLHIILLHASPDYRGPKGEKGDRGPKGERYVVEHCVTITNQAVLCGVYVYSCEECTQNMPRQRAH